MIGAVPAVLAALMFAVCAVAWLTGRVVAGVVVYVVEQLAAYSAAGLVMVGPALVLLVATR